MNIKKMISILFIVILAFSFTACGGEDTMVYGDVDIGVLEYDSIDVLGVKYNFYDNGYALIETILHENAQLTDTVSYEGKEYTVIGFMTYKVSTMYETGAFGYGETRSSDHLILPSTIQNIPNYALAYCNAKTITLPANLKNMGNGVFSGCNNMESIDIPDSVVSIGASKLFQNCTSLKEVSFPSGCDVQFFYNTFEGCTSLEKATIPASADCVGGLCFYQCYSLTDVTIEDGVERIEESAFYNCPLLSTIVIPDSVKTISDHAFQECTGLTDITLSDNLSDVSANMFSDRYFEPVDVSGITIRVKADLVSYVQSIYPSATVVAK